MKQAKQHLTEQVNIEKDGDIIFITVAKYKLFMSYGKIGMDAYLLYSHLMFTARLQETNSVYATNHYLMKGLSFGKDRLQGAKNLLMELGLIETVTRHDESGKFAGSYIKVKTVTQPFNTVKESPQVSEPADGFTGRRFQTTNALTNNINALTNNINAYEDKPEKVDSKAYNNNKAFYTDGKLDKEKIYSFVKQHNKQVGTEELCNYLFQNKFKVDGKLIDIAAKIDEMHEQSLKAYNKAPVVSVEESNKQFQDSSGSFNKQLIIDYVKNKNMHKVLTADIINEWFNKYSETGFTRDGIIFDISFALDSCFIALKRKLKEAA